MATSYKQGSIIACRATFNRFLKARFLKTAFQLSDKLLDCLKATARVGRKVTARWIAPIVLSSVIGVFALGLTGCTQSSPPIRLLDLPDRLTGSETRKLSGNISEVAPPAVFLDLANLASDLQPQVKIVYPKPNQTVKETQVAVEVSLKGLSIYKDDETQLGPHLKVIIDNQPARDVYRLDESIEFSDLLPGSHTLRVLAVLPWGETFKNADAYAQSTFHVLAATGENTPAADSPVLTYSEPQGVFGAQPVPLDFYLSNAPLHLVAQESVEDDVRDWQIRCTVDGQSFLFDQWKPIYLQGLKPGQNWVQVELVDDKGDRIPGPFNSTVRLINYDPNQKDTLSKLIRGELPIEQIGQIVIPDYVPPVIEETPLEELPLEETPPEEPAETEEFGAEETEAEDSLTEDNVEEFLPSAEPEGKVSTESESLDESNSSELQESEAESLIQELEEKKGDNRLNDSIKSRDLNLEPADPLKNKTTTEEEVPYIERKAKEQNATNRDNQVLSPTQEEEPAPAESIDEEGDIEESLQSLDRAESKYLKKNEPDTDTQSEPSSDAGVNSLDELEKTTAEDTKENAINDLDIQSGADDLGEASTRESTQIPRTEKSIEAEPPRAQRPLEPNFLDRLKTRWRSFQKGQIEAQTETIRPSTAPAMFRPAVETTEVEAVDEIEATDIETTKAEADELEADGLFNNQPSETASEKPIEMPEVEIEDRGSQ